ncbi:MAG: 3-phosphoglycerate dehydrogenase, partial [Desulfobulbus sp.]
METFRVKKMNAIAAEGLELFDERYTVDENEKNPQGLIVRSSPVTLDGFPELLAIARAGSGVNNIPVEEASEKGICVFNAPGANAVVELVFTMLGIWVRNVDKGVAFCSGLKDMQGEELNAEVEARK